MFLPSKHTLRKALEEIVTITLKEVLNAYVYMLALYIKVKFNAIDQSHLTYIYTTIDGDSLGRRVVRTQR